MKIKKVMITFIYIAVLSASLAACSGTSEKNIPKEEKTKLTDQQLMADLWFQTAGETKALYYQGYNIGRLKLDTALAKGTNKKPAIILDLDETVLDNSPYQAMTVKEGKTYPYKWDEWIDKAESEALPGAIDFLKYAESKGVDIYYISDRRINQLDATIKNLEHVDAPQATKEHVLLKDPQEKGKEKRREIVSQKNDIVLLFGDNLSDFTDFDHKSVKERNNMVDETKEQFGDKYIIFPNPMYGNWESALYDYNSDKSDQEKIEIRQKNLKTFEAKQ
ncbi:5'-nucleotidase, lipoprotein e(P4) family [Paenibacillus larvae]|uniref:Acid phosphatase n=3 Tax=Paenibacillus larvae TaxID=1464 RepID=A0A2L1UEP8_9BACL|nr:5'-nucleotidase, lipoprotein e(P4) family [Paenibacillus larvae]AQR76783.1 5'-nucleotidase, lipoprotein e(P4) family [Paenibacillus larvae subsp. larvae]AQT83496.1 5'-nucleotidase, lipoprotein e(P4) family [Paenibacillus larvae subsp. pulvifaciens]AQZ48599.1 5'-nucleotidase, lipoprotein e(P4) family [Paenibacillus larvae subsp. pulvifaciens]ARF70080.1 5'-nucleotidase, lipoprotein e(P4) family [Paenibacillus larvae subsp. pulvifaciens]AVF22330.1 acid phosphatase [Paenibacillus larvae subsp. 